MYPPAEPYETRMLDAPDGHTLYCEQIGNPDGMPVIYLHGGPGAGAEPIHRRFFDPETCRLVIFHQRGAGNSLPSASIEANTTAKLIEDIELVRETLGIRSWLVTGGSWGSCLALVYAIKHPDKCRGLVLRGIFLGSADEVRWWFHGRAALFPDLHEAFCAHVGLTNEDDLLAAYYERLIDEHPSVHMPAAKALREYSMPMLKLKPMDAAAAPPDADAMLRLARLWTHYCVNGFFLPENYILDHTDRLTDVPVHLVQGRYDVVTPAAAAWRLHKAVGHSTLDIVQEGGHSLDDPALAMAVRRRVDELVDAMTA